MSQRWEYAALLWRYRFEKKEAESEGYLLRWELFVYRPGGSDPERLLLSSTKDGEEVTGGTFLEALNDLGAEGWELVTDTALESVVGKSPTAGWPEAGFPVHRQWVLKRRAE